MRPIDAVSISEGIELHRQPTDKKYEMDHQWAVGYNAGLDRALYSIAYAKTIDPPPNAPLALEELREMDGEPVWLVTSADSPQWAFVADVGHEEFISFNCADGTEWEFDLYGDNDGVEWTAYRRKLEEETP